jgi:hypothetical protein
MKKAIFLMACIIVLAACTSLRQEQKQPATFNPMEFAPYTVPGNGVITGQASLRTPQGEVWYGDGSMVVLQPDTPYTRRLMEQDISDGSLSRTVYKMSDPRLEPFVRTTTADAQGRFRFEGVPKGRFIVICPISRRIPGRSVRVGATVFSQVRVGAQQRIDTNINQRISRRLLRDWDARVVASPGSKNPHSFDPIATR